MNQKSAVASGIRYQISSPSVLLGSSTSAVTANSTKVDDQDGQETAGPELELVENTGPATGRSLGWGWTAAEPVRKSLVGPTDQHWAKGDGEADVRSRQTVRECRSRSAPQVHHRECQECNIDRRHTHEEESADPRPTQQVPECQPGQKCNPESNLAAHDEHVQHAFTGAHRRLPAESVPLPLRVRITPRMSVVWHSASLGHFIADARAPCGG